jgi:hypothetical protein
MVTINCLLQIALFLQSLARIGKHLDTAPLHRLSMVVWLLGTALLSRCISSMVRRQSVHTSLLRFSIGRSGILTLHSCQLSPVRCATRFQSAVAQPTDTLGSCI